MFLSKIWFVLVGLAAGVATTAAFIATRVTDRRIVQLEGERLDRAQYAAEQTLKVDAHSWIDYVAKLSRDANLAESLDAASRSAGEPRLLHETVRGRLAALVPDIAGIGLQTVGAVDGRGRLIARLGERENDHGESLAGIEVISDALRGYLSDDVWGAGGKLQRVAAVPVLSRARDRIVGALWVGAETGKRLAEVWKQSLGVDIAILLRGQVIASTVGDPFLSDLPARIGERRQQMMDLKRTRPIPLAVGRDRLLVVAAPFVGQAGEQGGVFALIRQVPPATDPLALFKDTKADDLRWANFPWLRLLAALIVILGVGLALQRLEAELPLHRLRDEVQRLARGEVHKLNDAAHPGRFGGIARDVNAALEKFTLDPALRPKSAPEDAGGLLGSPPATAESMPPASVFDLPQSHFDSLGSAPPAEGFGGSHQASPAFPSPLPELPPRPPPREASPPRLYGGPAALSAAADLGATPERRLISPRLAPAPPADPRGKSAMEDRSSGETAPPLPPRAGTNGEGDDLVEEQAYAAHIREVFEAYVATRRRCGETVATLTLEKFQARLEGNRQQLMAKYSCRGARFSVYVKDGKAAVKATPLR
jgi:hypothetical protein